MVQLRAASPSTYHLLHVPSQPLLLPSVDRRSDILEADMPSQKRLCHTAPTFSFEKMAPKKTTTPMTDAAIKQLIAQGVADALAEYKATSNSGNSDDSHDSGSDKRTERITRECTYSNFLKCQPLNFKGTEGVTIGHDAAYGMTWKPLRKMMTDKYCLGSEIKKLEMEMEIWNLKKMPPKRTTTLMTDDAIKQFIAQGVAYALAEYEANRGSGNADDSHDSRTSEITQAPTLGRDQEARDQTVEPEGNIITNSRVTPSWREIVSLTFSEASVLHVNWTSLGHCVSRMGIPDKMQGSVMASKPKTMQDTIEIANELMEQKVRAYAQQQSPNKQSVAIAYTAGSGERKEYSETLPLCNNCKFYHNDPCTVKCANCKRVGHLTRDCKSPINNQRTLTCYECKSQGHYRSDCPELKNQNHRNQAGGTKARRMMFALGGGETDQDPNNMENDIDA
nr:hypothetical protein [Tanacetum cinerariifolium]